MSEFDPKEIDEALDEAARLSIEHEGEYELEIYMSTDGKHTVHGKATTPEGKKRMWEAVTKIYDQIKERYGTKQAQAVKEYKNGEKEDLGKCSKCGAPNFRSQKGKIYCSNKCWLTEEA